MSENEIVAKKVAFCYSAKAGRSFERPLAGQRPEILF
jgi:hypothetical protein